MKSTTIIAVLITAAICIGGTLILHKPSFHAPKDETVMTAKFTFAEQKAFFGQIQKSILVLGGDTSRINRKIAYDSAIIKLNWLNGVIDSIYTNK